MELIILLGLGILYTVAERRIKEKRPLASSKRPLPAKAASSKSSLKKSAVSSKTPALSPLHPTSSPVYKSRFENDSSLIPTDYVSEEGQEFHLEGHTIKRIPDEILPVFGEEEEAGSKPRGSAQSFQRAFIAGEIFSAPVSLRARRGR